MTTEQIQDIAERTAAELNLPWDASRVEIRRPPFGKMSGICRVTSTSALPAGQVTTTLIVSQRKGTAVPVRVRYTGAAQRKDPVFFAGQLAIGALTGGIAFAGLTRFVGVSVVIGGITAIAIGLFAMVYTIRFRKL